MAGSRRGVPPNNMERRHYRDMAANLNFVNRGASSTTLPPSRAKTQGQSHAGVRSRRLVLVLASGASAEAPVIASIPNRELGHQALDGKEHVALLS